MNAVIMAGGEGARLRPLTENCPKPLVRLCGRPIIDYILDLLENSGVRECTLTLGYRAEQLIDHCNARSGRLRIQYVREERPLGTAGGVKNACGSCDESVLVISGDALCDFPLAKALAQHLRSNAAVTIVTARVDDPREYGLVLTDSSGRVTGFIEKPSYAQATGGLANTGIYILSPRALNMIPDGEKFDFAADLFPRMLAAGLPLHTCALPGYWCDIGDLGAFRAAQADLLSGRVRALLRGRQSGDGLFFAAEKPKGVYTLQAPVYIGKEVHIAEGAVIGPNTVLDDGCEIGAGTHIRGGVLLKKCVIGENALLDGAIVCAGAEIGSHAVLHPLAAIGENTQIGKQAVVSAGVRIARGKHLKEGQIANAHLDAQNEMLDHFDDEGLCGVIGAQLTVEIAVRLGCAVGTLSNGRPVGVGTADNRGCSVLAAALTAGIRSAGASVLDFGPVHAPLFDFAMGYNALQVGVYFGTGDQNRCAMRLACEAGLPAPRTFERQVEQLLMRGEFLRAAGDKFGDRVDLSGIGVMYQTELLRLCPGGLSGMRVCVRASVPAVRRLLLGLLRRLGCEIETQEETALTIAISENGRLLTLSDASCLIGPHHAVAAYGMLLFQQKKALAVENDFPRAIERFAAQQGGRVYRYLLCPADGADTQGRQLAAQQQETRDGLRLAIILLDYMKKNNLTLSALSAALPTFAVEEREIPINGVPVPTLEAFSAERAGEGVLVRAPQGTALLRARKNGGAIRVFAEAANWELANELCSDLAGKIRALLDKQSETG